MEFQFNKYNLDLTVIIHKASKNDTTYICNTCHSYLNKSHITAQADLWGPSRNLNRIERILIARRILFKNVTITPKGQFPKLRGAICNTPIDSSDITSVLPHGANKSGLIMVKSKHKLSFQGHLCFSPVSPESVYLALSYLMVGKKPIL